MEIIKDPKEKNFTTLKVALIGDTSMGKTTFLYRLFSQNYLNFLEKKEYIQNTNGASYRTIYIKIKVRIFLLDLWDTAGLRKYSSLIKHFYKDAKIILIFYDPFDKSSFKRVDEILYQINSEDIKNVIIGLISNKYDKNLENINNENIISDEETLEYVDKHKLYFSHLSNFVKYETGINQIFELILKEYLKREKK